MRGGKRPGAGRPRTAEARKAETKKQAAERRQTLVDLASAYTEEALDTLAQIMRSQKATASARVAAANSILDRAHGKPPQAIEHIPTVDDLDRAIAVIEQRMAATGEAASDAGDA